MTAYGTARGWAWGIVAAVGLSQAVWLWLLVAHRDQLPGAVARSWPIHAESAVLVTFIAALGALIIGTYPRHRVGWIMVGVAGTVVIDATARVYALAGLYLRRGALPGPEYGAWVAEWLWFPSMVALLVFLPLYFPDGRLPSRRWRPVVMGMALWLALASIGYALAPQSEPIDFPDVEKAIQYQPAIVLSALMLGTPVALGLSFTAVLLRRRRAVGVEREQLRWFLYAVALVVAGWTISIAVGTLAGTTWGLLGAALTHGPLFALVAAITFAIRWHRLYDIDFLINRTLIYGGLTAAVLVAYGAIVLAASLVSTAELEWRGSVLVVAVVAIAAYPVRDWLQRAVNRLMYGDRDDPARAMSRLSRRVADSLSPASLLPAIAETVGRALRLPYVAVELPGRRAVAYGVPGDALEGFPLVHQGEHVGTLMVGRRSASESFSAADRSVIADLARQVAAAAHAVNLSDELQRSRERLVQAREEERLRLRRDLHDGVGSALAGLALRAGTARHAPGEGGEARRVLGDLEDGIRAAVLDIRRIVDDLRPPAVGSDSPGRWRSVPGRSCRESLWSAGSMPEGSPRPWRLRHIGSRPRHWPTWRVTRVPAASNSASFETTAYLWSRLSTTAADCRRQRSRVSGWDRCESGPSSSAAPVRYLRHPERRYMRGSRFRRRWRRTTVMAEEPVEVVIVDDHPVFREGLRAVVQSDSVLRVVGEYADGLTAATAIEELQPDVVLMDLNLPGLTGVEATRRVVASSPHAAVLVLTMVDDGDSVFAAMRAGARGYLLKGAVPEEILRGVHAVARGEVIFGPGVAERVRRFFTHPRSGIGAFPELTSREGEVLELIAAGSSNPDIARKLFISPKTVRNHISNIFAKLQVADRAEAVEVARGAGLGRGD